MRIEEYEKVRIQEIITSNKKKQFNREYAVKTEEHIDVNVEVPEIRLIDEADARTPPLPRECYPCLHKTKVVAEEQLLKRKRKIFPSRPKTINESIATRIRIQKIINCAYLMRQVCYITIHFLNDLSPAEYMSLRNWYYDIQIQIEAVLKSFDVPYKVIKIFMINN